MVVLLGALQAFASGEAPDAAALLAAYEAVRVPLVGDRLAEAHDAARALAGAAGVPAELAVVAAQVADAADATATRTAFGQLSRALVLRWSATGEPDGLRVFHCPMWPTYSYWLQASSGIANPYMGTSMPTCGEGTSLKAAVRAAAP